MKNVLGLLIMFTLLVFTTTACVDEEVVPAETVEDAQSWKTCECEGGIEEREIRFLPKPKPIK